MVDYTAFAGGDYGLGALGDLPSAADFPELVYAGADQATADAPSAVGGGFGDGDTRGAMQRLGDWMADPSNGKAIKDAIGGAGGGLKGLGQGQGQAPALGGGGAPFTRGATPENLYEIAMQLRTKLLQQRSLTSKTAPLALTGTGGTTIGRTGLLG